MFTIIPGAIFQALMATNDANVFHLILGQDARDGEAHACVGLNGRIVHDPNPTQVGLAGQLKDWDIGLFVKTFA